MGADQQAFTVGDAEMLVSVYAGLLPGHAFSELRLRGYDAWSINGNDQLDLPLAAPPIRTAVASAVQTTASARHVRPICALADFTSVCRLVGETSSRLEKIRHLATYLKSLENEDILALAANWLTGRALPRDVERRRCHSATPMPEMRSIQCAAGGGKSHNGTLVLGSARTSARVVF